MTTADRVQAVADYGFTERQARFLVLVMRHSGLCVKRQYAGFAGIANGGEKCNAFFDKLVRRGHGVAVECIHNRARLYHIHNRLLYHAIGEPDSRYRRPVPARLVTERLMRLDAALTSPDCGWLTTRADKLAYLQATAVHDEPRVADQFPGTFPIGIDPTGRIVLLYLATVRPGRTTSERSLWGTQRCSARRGHGHSGWCFRSRFGAHSRRIKPSFTRS